MSLSVILNELDKELMITARLFLTTVFQMDPCLLRSSGVSRTYELVTNVLPQKSQWLVELLPTPAGQTGD